MKHYWQGKVVVITGGSRGFGKALATAFAIAGAHCVLASRDPETLARTCDELAEHPGDAIAVPTDLTDDDSVANLFAEVEQRYGRLNALINVAGVSARGTVLDTSVDDFLCSFDLNVLSVVRATQQAAALLRQSEGHLVNIGSLASKSASKWIGPYATSKFALAGLTHQLRLELEPDGIHVLLVCPGPIARDGAAQQESQPRYADQTEKLPEEAKLPGAGVKVKTIDPAWLAGRILEACERRQGEIVVPSTARLLFALSQLSPAWGDWLLKKFTSR